MVIGVDCDGVLTDLSTYIWHYGEVYFNKKPIDKRAYNVTEIFQCTKRQEYKFWLRYFWPYCKKWLPRDKAVKILGLLNQEGHELYEITARMFVTRRGVLGWYSRHVLRNWGKKSGFSFSDIYFCDEKKTFQDKLAGCHRYGIELMIDDKPDVALYLAEKGIRILLFDTEYNQGITHDNIVRVYSWEDIYTKIQMGL